MKKYAQGLLRTLRQIPVWALGAIALGLAGIMAAAVFFAGFEVGVRKFPPYSILAKIDYRLWQRVHPDASFVTSIETGLLSLSMQKVAVGKVRAPLDEKGGGLTSFGRDVLVIPYRGQIYAASGPDNVRATKIFAPDNNRPAYQDAYRALLSDPQYSSIEAHGVNYLRYNDLLYFDSPQWRGLLISYIEFHPDDRCVTNTIARLPVAADVTSIDDVAASPNDWEVIFRAAPCLPFIKKHLAMSGSMSGGRLLQMGDASVYFTSGDFGFDGARSDGVIVAQDDDAQYGKVLEIDVLTGDARIVSKGHRNSQGIARTRDGHVFAIEHGPRGGDELNRIRDGANFGWPDETLGTLYVMTKTAGAEALGRHDRFDPPAYAWMPSPAVSSMTRIEDFHPAWDGDLLVSTLKDNKLIRLRTEGERVLYAENIPIAKRIRAIHQHNDGKIVLWTEDHDFIFLTAADLTNEAARLEEYLSTAGLGNNIAQKLRGTIAACAECHSFSPGTGGAAPSLANVADDKIGSGNFVGYSAALQRKQGLWTEENLAAFLADPNAFAQGTSMPDPGLDDPALIKAVAAYLHHIDDQR